MNEKVVRLALDAVRGWLPNRSQQLAGRNQQLLGVIAYGPSSSVPLPMNSFSSKWSNP